MQRSFRLLLLMGGLLLSAPGFASDLPGRWTLTVENGDRHAVTTLVVKFTDKEARSCMEGDWKALKVLSAKTNDKEFFPSSDRLSYQLEGNRLTIGRNELCDAYLWLRGMIGEGGATGDYFGFGLGTSVPLGHFRLERAK
jgi:hypothetical protein